MEQQQSYHAAVAVGHYARVLAARSKSNGAYQVVAVLSALWLRARYPFASSATVFVCAEYLLGIVPNAARLSQVISSLRAIGAIAPSAETGGYLLMKPPFAELDAIARAEIEHDRRRTALAKDTTSLSTTPTSTDAEAATEALASPKITAAARRREALQAVKMQLSDVRDVLATLANIPKEKRKHMKYYGKGSAAVQLAADFIVEHGWVTFVSVCRRVKADTSADKPADLKFLFAERNAEYLNRFITKD